MVIYLNVAAAGGGTVDVDITAEGLDDSHLMLVVPRSVFSALFVRRDGTVGLTGAWAVGSQNITGISALESATLNTGQGANELYAMNQDVQTTDIVTFGGFISATTTIIGNLEVQGSATSSDLAMTNVLSCSGALQTDGAGNIFCGSVSIAALVDITDVDATADDAWGNLIVWDGDSWTEITTSTLSISLDDIVDGSTYVRLTVTKDGYIDQDVSNGASPTFGNLTVTDLDTGQGANELYAMNQDVQMTDSVTFDDLTVTFGGSFTTTTITNATSNEMHIIDRLTVAGDTIISGNTTTTGNLYVGGDITGIRRYVSAPLFLSWASTTATSTRYSLPIPFTGTTTDVMCEVSGASSEGLVTFDVNIAGSTILATKVTIDATETGSDTAAAPYVFSGDGFNKYDVLTVDIDTSGNATLGGVCVVTLTELSP